MASKATGHAKQVKTHQRLFLNDLQACCPRRGPERRNKVHISPRVVTRLAFVSNCR
jgi:hypothetical protein